MSKNIIAHVFGWMAVIGAFFSWRAVDRAIFVEGAGDFWVPLFFVSVFVVAIDLVIVLIGKKRYFGIIVFGSLFPSLFFSSTLGHLATVVVAATIIFVAGRNIKTDIDDRVKIRLMKSFHQGAFMVMVGIVMVISSQYYFSIKKLDSGSIVPNISDGGVASTAIDFLLPLISPEFRQTKSDGISVDEFLGGIYEKAIGNDDAEVKNITGNEMDGIRKEQMEGLIEAELGRELTVDEKEQVAIWGTEESFDISLRAPEIKEDFMREWKRELSRSIGIEVVGNENVADIFVAVMNSRMDKLTSSNMSESQGALPAVFALMLFLTLIPVGSLMSRVWTSSAAGIFWIMRRTGVINVETETKEAEVIR